MSSASSALFPLPDADAVGLCKRLGLALSNAAMYGMDHAVTASSQNAAFDSLVALLDIYGEIEWAMCDEGLLLNRKSVDITKGMIQPLIDQMRRGSLNNFAFCPPLDRREFSAFMAILSAEPGAELIVDGIDVAMVKAEFKSIRVDKAVYARVGSKGGEKSAQVADTKLPASAKYAKGATSNAGRVFDLDCESLSLDSIALEETHRAPVASVNTNVMKQAARYLEQRDEIRKQHVGMVNIVRDCATDFNRLEMLRQQMLSSGFSAQEWESLLMESGISEKKNINGVNTPLKEIVRNIEQLAAQDNLVGSDPESLTHALKAIGREVDLMIRHTQGQTNTLAQRVDADRGTVAELENQARARGVGLQLSREELLESLAEINQELVQPLTASSALLQLLITGKAGDVSASQRGLLQTASEGMERLEKLIGYLQHISGFPVELSPDQNLLSEVYSSR